MLILSLIIYYNSSRSSDGLADFLARMEVAAHFRRSHFLARSHPARIVPYSKALIVIFHEHIASTGN